MPVKEWAETKNSARVGLELDFYEPKNGDKRFGKITKMSSKGYQVKDDKGKTYSFMFHDRNKAQALLKGKSVSLRNQVEEALLTWQSTLKPLTKLNLC